MCIINTAKFLGEREVSNYLNQPTHHDEKRRFSRTSLIYSLILVFLWGCAVDKNNLESLILGTWHSDVIETEMGSVRHIVTFTKNHHFRLESHFSSAENPIISAENPIITEGGYEVIGPHLFAKKLNKGKPIPIEFGTEGNDLVISLPGEDPVNFVKKR